MSQTDQKIDKLSTILEGFIQRQESFNEKQESFNEKQISFNEKQISFNEKQESFSDRIESKIDKTQYFLEECIASNAKLFFEEQTKQAVHIRELDDEVANLKSNLYDMSLQLVALQKA